MTPREALATVAACVEDDALEIRPHVRRRMRERGFMEADLYDLLCNAEAARSDGHDEHFRARWFLTGKLADGTKAELLVTIDATPFVTAFTIYWT